MIRARIQIENGEIYDITEKFGLVYLNGDKRFAAPIKDFEETSYPEQAGVNILPKTTDDAFEYKVELFIKTDDLSNANKRINTFNKALYTQEGDIKTFKRIAFYDDYKGVKIVGYPKPMSEATEFWRDRSGRTADVVCCGFIIKVDKPNLCIFDTVVFVFKENLFFEDDNIAYKFSVNDDAMYIIEDSMSTSLNINNETLILK